MSAAGAGASPVWKFGGTTLTGTETIVGSSPVSTFTTPA